MFGSAVVGAVAKPFFNLIDDLFTSDEEREKAKLAVIKAEQEGRFKEAEQQISVILAEANSKDPYTSRARPSFLYLMYFIILLTFIGGIIGIWAPNEVAQAAKNIKELLGAIPEALWWLFGAGYTGYTAGRSFDKWRKLQGK